MVAVCPVVDVATKLKLPLIRLALVSLETTVSLPLAIEAIT